MAGVVPALSLGRLTSAQRCRRFLATLLDPETKPRPVAKGAFRLDSAVREALRVAHEVADQQGLRVSDTLDERAPPGLSAEERVRFSSAVRTYEEFVGDDEVTLHPSVGEFLERASRTGRFRLTGRNDTTVVHRISGQVEIRRIHLGSRRARPTDDDTDSSDLGANGPSDQPLTLDTDALLALLVTKGAAAESSVAASVRHLWLGATTGESLTAITTDAVATAARQLTSLVESALDEPAETPGWWCDRCPAIRSCMSVSSVSDHELASRLGPTGERPVSL